MKNQMLYKNTKLKIKDMVKKTFKTVINTDIDFLFMFMIIFIVLNVKWYYGIILSIGLTYWYKKIIKDIITVKITSHRK